VVCPPKRQYEIVDCHRDLRLIDFAWPERASPSSTTGRFGTAIGTDAAGRAARAALEIVGWVVISIVFEDVRYRHGSSSPASMRSFA